MNRDGRALTERAFEDIQKNIFAGLYDDHEIGRLFETIVIQRRVLKELFNLFQSEPLRRVSTADPVRNSHLNHLKELVSLDDRRSPDYRED